MAEATTGSEFKLTVRGRIGTGKSVSYQIRTQNLIPGVVYGPKMKKAIPVTFIPKDIRDLYAKTGRTGLVTLEAIEGAPAELNGAKVLFKEIQSHPYKNILTHVDLHQLDLDRPIRVTVPLNFIGKAKGTAEGGIMSIVSRQVEIKCLPQDIPNHIDVDVSALDVNDSIHVSELSKKMEGDKKLEFIFENDFALVAVVPPEEEKVAEVAAPVEGAVAAAPGAPGAAPAAGGAPAAGAPAAGGKAPAAAAKAPAKK